MTESEKEMVIAELCSAIRRIVEAHCPAVKDEAKPWLVAEPRSQEDVLALYGKEPGEKLNNIGQGVSLGTNVRAETMNMMTETEKFNEKRN